MAGSPDSRRRAPRWRERGPRFGGALVSERIDGFLLDGGADSWIVNKPQASTLARELGLASSLLGTNEDARRYYIVWGDRLHAVPEGLVLGVPTRVGPLLATRLFSVGAKLRMALEPLVPARRYGPAETDARDESIADFARRRLGREAAERLVAPLLGGISASDASEISVRAAFPQLVAMEEKHGSLVLGMREVARARRAGSPDGRRDGGAFVSLEGGVGDLVRALVAALAVDGAELRGGSGVRAVARDARGFSVELETGERLAADAVLLAVPGHAGARITAGLDADLSNRLTSIAYTSTATVFLAYRRADVSHPLDGVGFVVPRSLGRPILAATWVSSKWKGRAPEGHVLLRAFFGGSGREDTLARDDSALAALACAELRDLMGISARPLFSRVFRFEAARAQMRVGHLAAMRDLRARLTAAVPGLLVAGDGFDGAGIPDCVRQGTAAGRALVDGQNSAGSL